MNPEVVKNLRYNIVVNIFDGAFFGAALGFASFVTVIPLFVSSLTDSAILIGLIPAIHTVGWQLPQLLTAGVVSRQQRYKPLVLFLTIQERLPFLGLALVAWFLPRFEARAALALTFILLVWQGFGGGFTATAWQSLIAKIIMPDRLGTFLGAQAAVANLFASGTAVIAGFLLEQIASPIDFGLCFLLASASMTISWFFLSRAREHPRPAPVGNSEQRSIWENAGRILRSDRNFRWFLLARILSQLAMMALAFYTVYAVRVHGMSEAIAGLMTGALMAIQFIASPVMGWIGDRKGHRVVLEVGSLSAVSGALLAWWAPEIRWFFPVFLLAGIANVATWTTPMAMTIEFGSEDDRPAYIGLANTLIAPGAIAAPLLGGWLADQAGYPATFLASAAAGLATILVLHFAVRDPRQLHQEEGAAIAED